MNRLQQLQRDLQDSVLGRTHHPALTWVSDSGRARPAMQLGIYLHAYRARLKEVLVEDFPVLAAVLGERQFDRLSEDYISRFPSRSFTLRDFGRDLPAFVMQWRSEAPVAGWAELAEFEWRLLDAFDAPQSTLLSEQDLATLPAEAWATLHLSLHPAVQRLMHYWNSVEIWQAYKAGHRLPSLQVLSQAQAWLIWRDGLTTRFVSLSPTEQRALEVLTQGRCFADMCEALAGDIDDESLPLYAASLIKDWIHKGLFSELRTTED